MGRALALLLVGLLAVALFWMPPTEPARVAALCVPELLSEKITVAGAETTLGDAILAGPAARRVDDGRLTLRLGGVRLVCSAYSTTDLGVHGLARAALISGLRRQAAARGDALAVEGELLPVRDGAAVLISLSESEFGLSWEFPSAEPLDARRAAWRPPNRNALLPPLLAILLALLLRRPLLALFLGLWAAAYVLRHRAAGAGGAAGDLARSLRDAFGDFLWPQLAEPGHLAFLGFVVTTLAMAGVMCRSGGLRGLQDRIARFARDARRTQIASFAIACCVFFDEHASALLTGSTLRSLADRLRLSREKLAYLVDTSATTIAGLALFGAGIAFAVGETRAQLPAAGLAPAQARALFLEALPFRFYSILALVLCAAVALSGRDFGPMLGAERRARRTGLNVRAGGRPLISERFTELEAALAPRARRALVPLFVFLLVALLGFLRAEGDTRQALLAGGVAGLVVAGIQALAAGLGLGVLRAAWEALRSTLITVLLLVLCWAIGAACESLGTATYVAALLGDHLAPQILPAILFLSSAAVAFATGSAWLTLGTLLPLVVGLSFHAGGETELGGRLLLAFAIGAVLDGAICGRHLSPLADSTVLSSTASGSDHADHVRTQLPYALTCLLAALLLGFLPCVFAGRHPALALLLACGTVLALLFVLGRRSDPPTLPESPAPAG